MTIKENKSNVELTIIIQNGKQPDILSFTTYLLKLDNKCLVDSEKALSSLLIHKEVSKLTNHIEKLIDDFSKQIESSIKEFENKTMPKIKSDLQEIERQLKEKLPKIESQIDNFFNDLEVLIQESLPRKKQNAQVIEV